MMSLQWLLFKLSGMFDILARYVHSFFYDGSRCAQWLSHAYRPQVISTQYSSSWCCLTSETGFNSGIINDSLLCHSGCKTTLSLLHKSSSRLVLGVTCVQKRMASYNIPWLFNNFFISKCCPCACLYFWASFHSWKGFYLFSVYYVNNTYVTATGIHNHY